MDGRDPVQLSSDGKAVIQKKRRLAQEQLRHDLIRAWSEPDLQARMTEAFVRCGVSRLDAIAEQTVKQAFDDPDRFERWLRKKVALNVVVEVCDIDRFHELIRQTAEAAGVQLRNEQIAQSLPPAQAVLNALADRSEYWRKRAADVEDDLFWADSGDEATDAAELTPRQLLVSNYLDAWGCTKTQVYDAAGVDRADFYKWQRGKFTPRSKVSQRITAVLTSGLPPEKARAAVQKQFSQ